MSNTVQTIYTKKRNFKNYFERCNLFGEGVNCLINDLFVFRFHELVLTEVLEIKVSTMVWHKAINAYRAIQVPCIVEHAGLILADFAEQQFPGGLTQPMWDALGPQDFLAEIQGGSRKVIARAAIGYCDGKNVRVLEGDTYGTLAKEPRGCREFYWDTVFVPDDAEGAPGKRSYAEICDDADLGIEYKVLQYSQSRLAMEEFLQFRLDQGAAELFDDF